WLPLPEEREPVVGGATAPTLAMVSRGESFDLRGGVDQHSSGAGERRLRGRWGNTTPLCVVGDIRSKHFRRHGCIRPCGQAWFPVQTSTGCSDSQNPYVRHIPKRHRWTKLLRQPCDL